MISVITPVHESGSRYLQQAYESLLAQTYANWEWVILENNGGTVPEGIAADPRVCVLTSEGTGIGYLKARACAAAQGDGMLELDCDDELAPTALERVAECFATGADFVYSDCAYWQDKGDGDYAAQWDAYPFGERYGWLLRYGVEHRGMQLIALGAPPATPQNLRLVDWSPDHLRAWTRAAYDAVGGHDPKLEVGDDHDLIVRMYLSGARFVHVPECLYFYRVHPGNTVSLRNSAIRDATWGVYNRNIWRLAESFAADRQLSRIDLCGAHDAPVGYVPLDIEPSENGIQCDLNGPWPLKDCSVGVLRAHDAIEHLRDPVHTMNEAFRVLAPGGFLMISVPSTNGLGAFCDPTHVSFWNRLSFRYYCELQYMRYVPKFRGRFHVAKLIEWFPSAWHKENNVPYVEAHLIRLGAGYHPMGAL